MDIVPTKTSLAANEVIKEIPILQSKPNGAMTGSILLPIIPAYEDSSFLLAITTSAFSIFWYLRSISSNLEAGP